MENLELSWYILNFSFCKAFGTLVQEMSVNAQPTTLFWRKENITFTYGTTLLPLSLLVPELYVFDPALPFGLSCSWPSSLNLGFPVFLPDLVVISVSGLFFSHPPASSSASGPQTLPVSGFSLPPDAMSPRQLTSSALPCLPPPGIQALSSPESC